METKLCTKCGQVKPVSEFGLNKSKKDGLQCHCKECVKVYKKQHYEDNKQYYKDKAVAYRQAGREYLNDYKSHLVCSKCGEMYSFMCKLSQTFALYTYTSRTN